MNDILNDYRLMKIRKSVLCKKLGDDVYNAAVDCPLCIRAADVSNAIERVLISYKEKGCARAQSHLQFVKNPAIGGDFLTI